MLQGKKIIVGITGSIAAYKSIYLVRLLVKQGAEVKVIVTPAAKDFVPVLTLSTLSRNPVLSDMFDEQSWANHVMLGRWADLIIIAPLSCNTLAKMANGICDNLLMAAYLSAVCPVAVAPAMDEDMWLHSATKANLHKIESYGCQIIPVSSGDLASGLHGEGRMAEPEDIAKYIINSFFLTRPESLLLKGKKALVTAGPTYEPIDPVRFIGNHSSGKMGVAIAAELAKRGVLVTLVLGPVSVPVPEKNLVVVNVKTAGEMYEACQAVFKESDITIMAAAVADYSPVQVAGEKIKKAEGNLTLELAKTKDILKNLGGQKRKDQLLVGFALETDNEKENALGKLHAKNADMIILNSLNDSGAGFRHDTNKITIFGKGGEEINFPSKSKQEVAKDIIDTIIRLHYA
ncbi:MAG: bifunctional phosphopantothenoylcysteine decarboxylase/phosphopantothenate--cysteine ligase CoaBC [Chitinophagaceae bacterium]|nr:bifunctional phosphopantothenoylcysteine decarboxylase/phosphopantothenate--cysteine ligase CoaBC [Chitinophagaceae bacterium]